eukprot:6208318-Pleurochrysis_carterae.AAC.1
MAMDASSVKGKYLQRSRTVSNFHGWICPLRAAAPARAAWTSCSTTARPRSPPPSSNVRRTSCAPNAIDGSSESLLLLRSLYACAGYRSAHPGCFARLSQKRARA